MTKKQKKTKTVQEPNIIRAAPAGVEPPTPTPVPVKKPKLNTVVLKVKSGTLLCEQGTFQKGETFTVTKKRAERFDKNSVDIVQ